MPLLDLELDICDCLGIDIRSILSGSDGDPDDSDLDSYVQKLITIAKSKKKDITSSLTFAKKKYTDSVSVKNYVTYKFYLAEVQAKNFETDIMFTLKDKRALVNVEIKSTPDTDDKSLKNTIKKASTQLKIVNKTFDSCHQDILNETWSFVRVIAVPNVGDKNKKLKDEGEENLCCEYCKLFILDEFDLKHVDRWMSNLHEMLKTNESSLLDSESYKRIFTRLVG